MPWYSTSDHAFLSIQASSHIPKEEKGGQKLSIKLSEHVMNDPVDLKETFRKELLEVQLQLKLIATANQL